MKLLLIVLLAIVALADSWRTFETITQQPKLESSEQVCVPHATYKDYCNTCECSHDGRDWYCTKLYCDNKSWNKDGTLKFSSSEITGRGLFCEPYSSFKNYCNECKCLITGENAICENKVCDPKVWNKDGSLISEVGKQSNTGRPNLFCEPSATFKNYCNTCVCSYDGKSATCSMDDCDSKVWNKDGTLRLGTLQWHHAEEALEYFCEPGTTFKDYCDTCICLEDGRTAGCTFRQACDPRIWNQNGTIKFEEKSIRDPENFCEPRSTFTNHCGNECTCDYDGKIALCTLVACYPTFVVDYRKRLRERQRS